MRVFQTSPLPEPAGALLRRAGLDVRLHQGAAPPSRAELMGAVADAEGLLCLLRDTVDDDLMSHAPLLRVISNYAVGFDNIDIAAATRRGIVVTNTPGVLDETTADLAFALMLAVARRVIEGDRVMRAGEFPGWAPEYLLGRDVHSRTIGIVGLGRIGARVARRARGFDMEILYAQPRRADPGLEDELRAQHVALDELLARSDFVSLHAPLNPSTRHLIGARELSLMRPDAVLINTARGPLVDEAALAAALRRGVPGGAGLDVHEAEPQAHPQLAALPNVVLLPHLGSATQETRSRMAEVAARNLVAALAGEVPAHPVNPEALR